MLGQSLGEHHFCLVDVLEEDFASQVASEHLLDLYGCLYLALVLLANANAQLPVAVCQELLIDLDRHLSARLG